MLLLLHLDFVYRAIRSFIIIFVRLGIKQKKVQLSNHSFTLLPINHIIILLIIINIIIIAIEILILDKPARVSRLDYSDSIFGPAPNCICLISSLSS